MDHARDFFLDLASNSEPPRGEWSGGSGFFDFGAFFRSFKRDFAPFLVWLVCCLILAGLVIYRTPVEYTASTQLLLEPTPKKKMSLGNETLTTQLDSAQADSRVQVMKSEKVLRFVFDVLDLRHSPDYASGSPSLPDRLTHLFSGASPTSPEERDTAAFLQFMRKVDVRRIGPSYVVEISFRAPTPRAAAKLANAISVAYIRDLVLSSQRDDEFLQRRIADIEAEAKILREDVAQGRVPDRDFSDANARIISAAIEPLTKSTPQTGLILLLATTFGVVTGGGAIFFRHNTDRFVRTRRRVQRHFGFSRVAAIADASRRRQAHQTPGQFWTADVLACLRLGVQPLINAIVKFDAEGPNRAIGLVSWTKGAGTSSVAYALSRLLGDCHQRPILIDANWAYAGLSELLAPDVHEGLSDALLSEDPSTCPGRLRAVDSLKFLPWGRTRGAVAGPLLGTWRMKMILGQFKDMGPVLIDLPPLKSSPDAQHIGSLLDGVIIVVDAAATTIEDVRETLLLMRDGQVHVIAIVVNKAEDISPHDDASQPGVVPARKSGFLKRRTADVLTAEKERFVPGRRQNAGRTIV